MEINVKQIPTGKWKENCYVVNNNKRDAFIIDPGGEEKYIIDFIEKNKLNIKAILNTHAHYDHIGAVKYIKDKYNIPFFLHSKDEKLLNTANLYAKLFEGSNTIELPNINYYFDEITQQNFIENFTIKILFTPGHTWGSVCFLIEDSIFTGDTLLNGQIGRIDLPGGNKSALKKSLHIISKLPKHTNIYPGHGRPTTLESELITNIPFMKAIK